MRILSSEIEKKTGKEVMMQGWAENIRLHSKVGFIDLRDRKGLTQIVATDSNLEVIKNITPESVLEITGTVHDRPQSLVNPNIISGKVEVQAESIKVITQAKPIPFPLNDDSVSEDIRLKYRYLDLRSRKRAENIRVRSEINQYIREYLHDIDFTEVETPSISKSTPEGARDYLVPSRIEPGKFYALPQSPQQYKQLLMVAGLERYFQLAKCYRDEDARGDRQPEFTQLDIELSFTDQDEVMNILEEMVKKIVKKYYPEKHLTFKNFPRVKYADAMKDHGSDRPDLRKTDSDDELAFAFVVDFPMFEWKETEKRWDATHHPFTAPQEAYAKDFAKQPKEALALQYDLVLNGFEVAGGSIRIHDRNLLKKVFEFLGNDPDKIEDDFGHLLEAFEFGVPPHGGIAMGLDRFYATLQKEKSIREVIAFPKNGEGKDLMMNSPSNVTDAQLKELHIKIAK